MKGRLSWMAALALGLSACTPAASNSAAQPATPVDASSARPGQAQAEFAPPGRQPSGFSHYAFGINLAETELLCRKSGTWDARIPTCDEPTKPSGLHFTVGFQYCERALCWIHLMVQAPSDDRWGEAYFSMINVFEKQFGRAQKETVAVPNECRADPAPCVKRGLARAQNLWLWEDGFAVNAMMSDDSSKPRIIASFANREGLALMDRCTRGGQCSFESTQGK